jgi:hypothetical protein
MGKNVSSLAVPSVAEELVCADLGDARRTKRVCVIAEDWSAAPDRLVPRASKSSAKTEGAYRFLNNESVRYDALVEAHTLRTCERIVEAGTAIVAHDTTELSYGGEVLRQGLGRLKKKNDQGFLAHVALAITADGTRRPLGVLGFSPWVRTGPTRRKKGNGKKRSGSDYAKLEDKESARWGELIDEAACRIGARASLIHVMDREADAWRLLCQMVEEKHRFVVRASKDRVVEFTDGNGVTELLRQAVSRVEGRCEIEVPISRRAKSSIPASAKTFPAREARVAKLEFAATTLRVHKPRYETNGPRRLDLNIVQVREVDVPEGAEPVEWFLLTTEPIATTEQILAIVEYYRTRWLIEELFKALKTGCAVEKRQHESLHALLNAVAICLPIAWQMLLLRNLARTTPEAPATDVLTPTQIEILHACSSLKADTPTVRQALYAVAALGGYLKNNGEPGWLALGRGMEYLLTVEIGWLARGSKK